MLNWNFNASFYGFQGLKKIKIFPKTTPELETLKISMELLDGGKSELFKRYIHQKTKKKYKEAQRCRLLFKICTRKAEQSIVSEEGSVWVCEWHCPNHREAELLKRMIIE